MEHDPGQVERRMPRVRQGTADRPAVRSDHAGGLVLPAGHAALNVAHAFDVLLELGLGMVVRFRDRLGRFLQIVEVAQLVRDVGQDLLDGQANRGLPIRDGGMNPGPAALL